MNPDLNSDENPSLGSETKLWQCGRARQRMAFRPSGLGMMGYGDAHNRAEYALSDLYVRVLCCVSPRGQRWVYCNAEICFITPAIRSAVLEALKQEWPELQESELFLSAQHTHSAPGGYSHYPLYNFTVPGFQPEILAQITQAHVTAILAARADLQPAALSYAVLPFPEQAEVAFNRSLEAYNSNPENTPLKPEQTHLAIDRNMYLLKAESPEGELLSVLNWFGVHATNLGPQNTGMSSDNKGYASRCLEEHYRAQGQDIVGIFAQSSAGDVSPNFYGQGKNWPRGKFDHDEESMRFNGRLHFEQAQRILERAEFQPLPPQLHSRLRYFDLSEVECDPDFTGGLSGCRTAKAAHGIAFMRGTTVDGPGVSAALASVLSALCLAMQKRQQRQLKQKDPAAAQDYAEHLQRHAPKIIGIESGRRQFLGFNDLNALPLIEHIEPVVGDLKRIQAQGGLQEHSWTPQVLALQYVLLGPLVIVGFPGEITTTACRRLKQSIRQDLEAQGHEVLDLVLCGYSNAYFGYATTPEEYAHQTYEGGHTVFGRWTLPAFQSCYRHLIQSEADSGLRPPTFSERELKLRTGVHP